MARELLIEIGEVYTQTVEQQRLDCLTLLQQNRRGKLDGSVERQVGIGNDLEASQGRRELLPGPADRQPRQFHLRQGGDLRDAAQGKSQHVGVADKGWARDAVVGVVKE